MLEDLTLWEKLNVECNSSRFRRGDQQVEIYRCVRWLDFNLFWHPSVTLLVLITPMKDDQFSGGQSLIVKIRQNFLVSRFLRFFLVRPIALILINKHCVQLNVQQCIVIVSSNSFLTAFQNERSKSAIIVLTCSLCRLFLKTFLISFKSFAWSTSRLRDMGTKRTGMRLIFFPFQMQL